MAGGAAARGHEVHLITSTADWTRSHLIDGVMVHALRREPATHAYVLGEAAPALSFAWNVRRKLDALQQSSGPFDIVEVPEFNGPGYFLTPQLPLVVKCHGHLQLCLEMNGTPPSRGTALILHMEEETLSKSLAIHANSDALADRCARDYAISRQRFTRIPYGIAYPPKPTASLLRRRLGLEENPVLLFVGRIEQRKGVANLTRAFAEVSERVGDVVLLLAGADVVGPEGSNVEWMCREWERLGVPADRYLFLGEVERESMPDVYTAADVMVAPSPFEAFGLVYLEAMAAGCPPIGCRTGGVPEVVEEGRTGLLVPPEDPSALAAAMVGLLTDHNLRRWLGENGRLAIEDRFTQDTMVSRTLDYYRQVMQ
jgi:glycosyltransferase involved in cell wall biosynthesis